MCGSGSLLRDGPDSSLKKGRVVASGCNAWTCPECGPLKAWLIRMRLLLKLDEVYEQESAWLERQGLDRSLAWRPFKLLTLTVDIKYFIPEERYRRGEWRARPEEVEKARRAVMEGLNRLRTWLSWLRRQRRSTNPAAWEGDGATVPYFWVQEFTDKNGWPHLHVIVLWRDRFSKREVETIRRLWDKYGLGKSVSLLNKNWERKDPRGLATYLAKYLGKSLHAPGLRPGYRRWSCSRGFLPLLKRCRWEGSAGWSPDSVERHRLERLAAGAYIRPIRRGFDWELEGVSVPISPLRKTFWEDVRRVRGGPAPPTHEYRYPGRDFPARLRLPPTRAVQLPDGTKLLIPDGVSRGIRPLRSRRPRRPATNSREP